MKISISKHQILRWLIDGRFDGPFWYRAVPYRLSTATRNGFYNPIDHSGFCLTPHGLEVPKADLVEVWRGPMVPSDSKVMVALALNYEEVWYAAHYVMGRARFGLDDIELAGVCALPLKNANVV